MLGRSNKRRYTGWLRMHVIVVTNIIATNIDIAIIVGVGVASLAIAATIIGVIVEIYASIIKMIAIAIKVFLKRRRSIVIAFPVIAAHSIKRIIRFI